MEIKPFEKAVYVTRPLLPDLNLVMSKLQEIWDSGQLTNNGLQHRLLERRLLEMLKVPYLTLCNNGTTALGLAIKNFELSGEVITTPFTFPATPNILTWHNIQPVFCDIDPVSMNMDPCQLEARITPRTTGILPVHTFGTPCDVTAIDRIAKKHGLKVLYDGAHAFGVEIENQGIGNFGDATMLSLHATKLFHTVEGGVILYRDEKLKDRFELLKNFGILNEDEVVLPGINGKLNEVQAAIGLAVLECLEDERAKRLRICAKYNALLKDIKGLTLPPTVAGVKQSLQYYVIKIDGAEFGHSRDQVYAFLKRYNVFSRKYFYPLCSDYPFYKDLPSADPATLPVARLVSFQTLSLPFYGDLALEDVERICELLTNIDLLSRWLSS